MIPVDKRKPAMPDSPTSLPWMEEWFRARNLCPKFSLASKDVIDPRLREQMPARTMFYKMIHRATAKSQTLLELLGQRRSILAQIEV